MRAATGKRVQGYLLQHSQVFHAEFFNGLGLNLHAIFNLAQLPPEMMAKLDIPPHAYRQLIVLGHGGKAMWESLKVSGIQSDNPVDTFSIQAIQRYFAQYLPDAGYDVIYPGICPVGLQALGRLAGWHHASPLMLGINATWGTWYACRVVVLADTDFATTVPLQGTPPCASCQHKPCVDHCPAAALAEGVLDFQKCIDYRKQSASKCKSTCLARVSCPVAGEHRYSAAQIEYHYSISMKIIAQEY